MTIQITNLDLNITESDIRRLFTPFGEIGTVEIERDHINNRSRGRGAVQMPVEKEAKHAILNLNGTMLGKKKIGVLGMPDSYEYAPGSLNI